VYLVASLRQAARSIDDLAALEAAVRRIHRETEERNTFGSRTRLGLRSMRREAQLRQEGHRCSMPLTQA